MKQIFNFVWLLIVAVVGAMFAVGKAVWKESDGDAVNVTLTATVDGKQLAYVGGWAGITGESGASGDAIALDVAPVERQFEVPAALSVSAGDIVYIDTAQVTGHTPDDAGYATSAGAGLIPIFKATADKDANDIVTGILITKFN